MAFIKKTWTDRNTQYPTRRILTAIEGETDTYDVTRAEGTISAEGDAFNAANMNDLEDRIESAFEIITGTLTSGQTSITITDTSINTNSILSFYTSIYGANPEAVSVTNGSVTLTFEAQESNMMVGVKVEGSY